MQASDLSMIGSMRKRERPKECHDFDRSPKKDSSYDTQSRLERPNRDSNRGISYPATKQPRRAIPFEGWTRMRDSRWDVRPAGWENVSITALKLCNLLDQEIDFGKPPPAQVLSISSIPPLTANNSLQMCTVLVDKEDPSEYLRTLFKDAFNEDVPIDARQVGDKFVVQLATPKHAAYFLALHSKYSVSRFPGTVTTKAGSVFSSVRTSLLRNLKETDTPELVKASYPNMSRNPILIMSHDNTRCLGAGFALFDSELPPGVELLFPEENEQPSSINAHVRASDLGRIINNEVRSNNNLTATSRCLLILNATESFEIESFLLEGIKLECEKYGKVLSIALSSDKSFLPRVVVNFDTIEECEAALEGIGGRTLCGRTLITAFGNEEASNLGLY